MTGTGFIGTETALYSAGVGLCVNTFAMWITAKKIHGMSEAGLLRCLWCCIQLVVVFFISMIVPMVAGMAIGLIVEFLPFSGAETLGIGVVYIIWLVAWFKMARWVIESTFDTSEGGGRSILITYIVISLAVTFGFKVMGTGAHKAAVYASHGGMTKTQYCSELRQDLDRRLGDKFDIAYDEGAEGTHVDIACKDESFSVAFMLDKYYMTPLTPQEAGGRVERVMTIPPGERLKLIEEHLKAKSAGKSSTATTSLSLGISSGFNYSPSRLAEAAKQAEMPTSPGTAPTVDAAAPASAASGTQ